jgi:hypothetical protein
MDNLLCPQRIINPPRWTTPLMRFAPNTKSSRSKPRWTGSLECQNDPVTELTSAPEHRQQGFKAVEMCNNHCRKFDAGTMPQRDPRRTALAGPRQHLRLAMSGPDRRS